MQKIEEDRVLVQSVIDCIPDSIFVLDLDGRYRLANRAFAAIVRPVGRPIVGCTCGDLFPSEAAAAFAAADRQVMAGGRALASETTVEIDGRPHSFLIRRAPLRNLHDAITGLVGIASDIGDRKRAEDILRLGEARFRETIESLPFVTAVYRADGTAEFCNRRFFEYFGMEFSTRPADQVPLMHPADRELSAAARARTIETGIGYEIEVRLRRHDGAYRWHRVNTTPLHYGGGGVAGFVSTLVDIHDARQGEQVLRELNSMLEVRVAERTRALTEAVRELAAETNRRQEAQAALLQAQKLEALGQLVGGVAHDFNNVLAAIIGSYGLIEKRTRDPQLLKFVTLGQQAAERAQFLTRRLVGFARREDLRPTQIVLARFFADLARILPHSLGPGVDSIVDASDDVWPILADGRALEVALINLVVNARDAMPDGGTVRISARNLGESEVSTSQLKPGDYVTLSVADTGTGMPPEVLSRAMEPFFTTKETGKGSGLGLAMVYGLMTQLGGALNIDSQPGEGTTIHLTLPRAPVTIAAPAEPQMPPDQARDEGTILLVEDDEQVRPITAASLRELGYTVFEAAGAEIGLGMAATMETIDLAITDVVMPGVDGPTFAARVRAERPRLPVLFITGYAKTTDALRGETVLPKPFSSAQLGQTVRTMIRPRGRAAP